MLLKSILLHLAASAGLASANYDAECLYPEKALQDPFLMRQNIATFVVSLRSLYNFETPIVVRLSHKFSVCQGNCMAYHTPNVKDVLTSQPVRLGAPLYAQNPWSILMCIVQCQVYTLIDDASKEMYVDHMKDKYGFALQMPSDRMDIKDASDPCLEEGSLTGDCDELFAKIKDEDYDPYVMGHFIGNLVVSYFENDGWNADGKLQYDRETDSVVNCTGSCRPYQDTTGYAPVPDPRLYDGGDKYSCTGWCRRWQPLQEGDVAGNLVRQEFVAPHIGKRAKTFLRAPTLTLTDPGYNLREDSLRVIEEVKITSGDQARKDAIKVFDNKLLVRAIIQRSVKKEFVISREMSFQEYLLYLTGISFAEYDGLVQAWHEKVEHDLVRPTTVIKHWGSDVLNTYGGDPSTNGPVDIVARDFEAFIRVMPHAEFPSGSSCLCSAYAEFTDVYLAARYGRTITGITDRGLVYADMTELSDVCGKSRIWGGMHYPPAVDAGVQVCSGLGTLASDFTLDLEEKSTIRSAYYKGDGEPDRSQCSLNRK